MKWFIILLLIQVKMFSPNIEQDSIKGIKRLIINEFTITKQDVLSETYSLSIGSVKDWKSYLWSSTSFEFFQRNTWYFGLNQMVFIKPIEIKSISPLIRFGLGGSHTYKKKH